MRRFLVLSLLLVTSSIAGAGTPTTKATDVRQMHTDDCAQARKQNKTCVLDMGKGDDVTGQAPTAGGSAIGVIQHPKEASMIHIRRDFIVEILKSAEDL